MSRAEDHRQSYRFGYHMKGAFAGFSQVCWIIKIVHYYRTGLRNVHNIRFGALWMPFAISRAEDHRQSYRFGYHMKGAFAGFSQVCWIIKIVHYYRIGLRNVHNIRFSALWMPFAMSRAEDHRQSYRFGYHMKGAFAGYFQIY
ncbi:hypothetical protein [Sporosarcina sp. JAI121]|uniref:hypothetical protein n=1 Tax=Sporosarcina sp. JAI121 TaxID=2723064 RepID=UPI0015C9A0F4|nr:hypothetical protein [Sporosarcina sp. JAI121]NYF24069.1 hypothetical protein [Sporosarcina sp. JAI121]